MSWLPRLVGALIIAIVGCAIVLLPVVLLHRWWLRKAAGRWLVARAVVAALYWTWLVVASLIVLAMAVDAFGIDALQSAVDWLLAALPKVIVAMVVVAVASALLLLIASVGERAISRFDAHRRTTIGIISWIVAWPIATTFWSAAIGQIFGQDEVPSRTLAVASLVAIPWIILLRRVHAELRSRNGDPALPGAAPPTSPPPPPGY